MREARDDAWARDALRNCLSACIVLAALELAFGAGEFPALQRWLR